MDIDFRAGDRTPSPRTTPAVTPTSNNDQIAHVKLETSPGGMDEEEFARIEKRVIRKLDMTIVPIVMGMCRFLIIILGKTY